MKDKDQDTTPFANLYGQYNDFAGQQYTHPGVDLKADANMVVVAGTSGTVQQVDNVADPHKGITVLTEPTNNWVWAYWHLKDIAVAPGGTVTATTELAKIVDHAASWNHLHLGHTDLRPYDTGNQNPLRSLSYVDTIKPTVGEFRLYENMVEDSNLFIKTRIPNTNLGVPGKNQILAGRLAQIHGGDLTVSDIDVAVSAYDMVDGSNYHLGLYRMGYWIDGFSYLRPKDSVQTHTTFRFEGRAPNQTSGIKNLLYRDDGECNSAGDWPAGETLGQGKFWHIVTNTTDISNDGDPDSAGLKKEEAWKTWGGAAHNPQARSSDGEYNIVSYAHDQKLNSGSGFERVRLDNFEQVDWVRSQHMGVFSASPTYELVPDLYAREIAKVNPTPAWLGDTLGAKAEELLGLDTLTAYVQPHRAEGWFEGDSIALGAIAQAVYTTNDIGLADWQNIWQINRLGVFDVLFDYNHDTVFSYTLDPLVGFTVIVPEPSMALAIIGSLVLAARRRV